jgi:hypothetical protein
VATLGKREGNSKGKGEMSEGVCGPSVISFTLKGGCLEMPHLVWKQVGSKLAARWQQDGSKMAARWQQDGSKMAANGQQSEVLGYMYLLVKEVPLDNYKRLKYP